jgi:hypothetical protein
MSVNNSFTQALVRQMNFDSSDFPEYVSYFAEVMRAQGCADDMWYAGDTGCYVFAFDIDDPDRETWEDLKDNKRVLMLVDAEDASLLAIALEDFKETAGFLLHYKPDNAGKRLC